jgi:hypothetical protein
MTEFEENVNFDSPLFPQSGAELSYGLQFRQILDIHSSHHELVASIEAEVQRLDSRTLAERTEPYLRGSVIPESTRLAVDDAFSRAQKNWEEKASAKFDTAPADLETFLGDPEQFMFNTGAMEDLVVELTANMTEAALLPGAVEYFNALTLADTTSSREQLFMASALIVLVSTAETRLRRIMRRFVEIKGICPDPIERRKLLGQLFRGGLDTWEAAFRRELGVEIRDWSNEWNRITEIFARRHAHVHQGGVVDETYRKTTGSGEVMGMLLLLSSDYLNQANDILTGFTFGALYATWSEAKPSIRYHAAKIFEQYVHDALIDVCFYLVEQLAAIIERSSNEDDVRLRAKVNRLLALEARLGSTAIEDEVGAWNTSELAPPYKLARLIFLRQDDHARRLFEELRDNGVLGDAEVATWVIFKRWREEGNLT